MQMVVTSETTAKGPVKFSAKLPQPVALFSAYPGRTLRGVRVGIPEIDPARIPGDTEAEERYLPSQPAPVASVLSA